MGMAQGDQEGSQKRKREEAEERMAFLWQETHDKNCCIFMKSLVLILEGQTLDTFLGWDCWHADRFYMQKDEWR